MPEPSPSSVLHYQAKPAAAGLEPFDQLKELLANGYVPDSGAPGESSLLLRHKSAPDLLLHADGRIEVPIGQPAKGARPLFNWRGWLKLIALLTIGAIFWLVSVGVSIGILEGMGLIG